MGALGEKSMKYVVKPGSKTEIYQLDGFSIGSSPIAIIEGNSINCLGGFSLLQDSEFVAAVLACRMEPAGKPAALPWSTQPPPAVFVDLDDLPEHEPVRRKEPKPEKEKGAKFPPVQGLVHSALSTGPCTKSDIRDLLNLNNQKVSVALGSLTRRGIVVKNGEFYSLAERSQSEVQVEAAVEEHPVEPQVEVPQVLQVTVETKPIEAKKKVLLIGGIIDEKKLKLLSDRFSDFSFEWIPVYHDSSREMKRLDHIKPDYDRVILLQGLTSHSVTDKVVKWCRKVGVKIQYGGKGGVGSVERSLAN